MNSNKIKIENHNPFNLSIRSNLRDYILSPVGEDGTPTVEYLTLEEIIWVDSNTSAIRTGLITINEDDREEVFKEIKFEDGDKIITNKDVENILLNPSVDGLSKIIEITDASTFDRVYAVFVGLKEGGSVDISNRVINLMNERYKEFKRGQNVSHIKIERKDTETVISQDRAKELESQNESLKQELSELKDMMKQILASQNDKPKKTRKEKAETTEG